MTKILCIDTSVYDTSVAVCVDGVVISFKSEKDKNKSSEILNSFIEQVCEEGGIKIKDLDAIAIVSGPGSYTGLRIASSTAKGLCFGLEIPLIAVSSFDALRDAVDQKYSNENFEQYIFAIDARRDEIFAVIQNIEGKKVFAPGPVNLSEDKSFFSQINPEIKTILTGDGAEKTEKYLSKQSLLKVKSDIKYDCRNICSTVFDKYFKKEFENIAYFEPDYIKPAFTTLTKKVHNFV